MTWQHCGHLSFPVQTQKRGKRNKIPSASTHSCPCSKFMHASTPETQCCYASSWAGVLLLASPPGLDLQLTPVTMSMHTDCQRWLSYLCSYVAHSPSLFPPILHTHLPQTPRISLYIHCHLWLPSLPTILYSLASGPRSAAKESNISNGKSRFPTVYF